MRYAARRASCPPRLYFFFLGTQWNHISQRPLHFGVALWLVFANRTWEKWSKPLLRPDFQKQHVHSLYALFLPHKAEHDRVSRASWKDGSFLQPCMENGHPWKDWVFSQPCMDNGHPWPSMQHGMNKMLSPIRLRSLRKGSGLCHLHIPRTGHESWQMAVTQY